jgi:hypothetical protein
MMWFRGRATFATLRNHGDVIERRRMREARKAARAQLANVDVRIARLRAQADGMDR